MTYYERNLPHWHPDGKSVFVTWRLHGSLRASVLQRVQTLERERPGRAFVYADRELDKASFGPVWLKCGDVARCVLDSLTKGEQLQHYVLHAFVVIANHVHALIDPKVALSRLMNGVKGVRFFCFTAEGAQAGVPVLPNSFTSAACPRKAKKRTARSGCATGRASAW